MKHYLFGYIVFYSKQNSIKLCVDGLTIITGITYSKAVNTRDFEQIAETENIC